MTPFFVVMSIVFIISGCSDQTDIRSSHYEYMGWITASDGYTSMEGNSHQYAGIGVVPKRNRFPLGKGECLKKLSSITDRQVQTSIQGFNYYLTKENDYNDKRLRHLRFQCREYLGEKAGCRQEIEARIPAYVAEGGDEVSAVLLSEFAIREHCRNERVIGQSKAYHQAGFEAE